MEEFITFRKSFVFLNVGIALATFNTRELAAAFESTPSSHE